MGCDIHAFVEAKVDGKWYLFDQPDVDRHYALFGKMAAVRDGLETPIVEPKGLPEDISTMTEVMNKYWEGDGHTHSWFNQKEIEELKDWYDDIFEFYKAWGFNLLLDEENRSSITDKRLVFWFDN